MVVDAGVSGSNPEIVGKSRNRQVFSLKQSTVKNTQPAETKHARSSHLPLLYRNARRTAGLPGPIIRLKAHGTPPTVYSQLPTYPFSPFTTSLPTWDLWELGRSPVVFALVVVAKFHFLKVSPWNLASSRSHISSSIHIFPCRALLTSIEGDPYTQETRAPPRAWP